MGQPKLRHLGAALNAMGYDVSHMVVQRLLRDMGFSLQANAKTKEGGTHPDRDAQFQHINALVKRFRASGQPAISVDTKKKELVGNFKNQGRTLRPKGDPEKVRVHDFMIKGKGKVSPYGIYDIAANEGWENSRRYFRWTSALWNSNSVAGLIIADSFGMRCGLTKRVVSPSTRRSSMVRFGARCRERLLIRS